MSLASLGTPCSREVKVLWDTGAMPTIICESALPIGTEILPSAARLTGVSNKLISVKGESNVYFQLGSYQYQQLMIVVPQDSMQFPEGAQIILGANFLSHYQLTIDSAAWCITANGERIVPLLPSIIDSRLYAPSALVPSEPAIVSKSASQQDGSASLTTSQSQPGAAKRLKQTHSSPGTSSKRRSITFSSPPIISGSVNDSAPLGDLDQPSDTAQDDYLVYPCAGYELSTGITTIKVFLQHQLSDHPITSDSDNSYIVEPHMLRPGVFVTQTAVSGKFLIVGIYNANKAPEILQRGLPISTASRCDPESQFIGLSALQQDQQYAPMDMNDAPSRSVLMIHTVSEVTAHADDGNSSVECRDELDDALDFDPTEVSTTDPTYDEARLTKLLQIFDMESWQIPQDKREAAIDIIRRHQRAFNIKGERLPSTHLLSHKIEVTDEHAIIHTPPRWTPIKMRPFVEGETDALLRLDLAYRSRSPHTSPIVMVRKKGVGKWRMCVDYRYLNKLTRPMYYPARCVDDVLYRVAFAAILSILDMTQGYMQVPMDVPSQKYTAFSNHLGAFAFSRMSFGLRNAAFTLSMLMDMVFKDLRHCVENYHDDIYTFSNSVEEHFEHLASSLTAIIESRIQVSAEKTRLFVTQAHILGHVVGNGTIRPDSSKTEDILNMSSPKNRTGVRSFLGMTSFFRKFIPNYAKIAAPLTLLTSDKVPWFWSTAQETSFNTLKSKLVQDPVLRAPVFDATWYLLTDASSGAIGSWIAQRHGGHLFPVAYHSRRLKPHELQWALDPYEAEVLAIYDSLRKFKHFLYGSRLVILSDSQALQWLFSKSQYKSPRLTRWALSIQSYGADLLHLPGRINRPADTLSRYPVHELLAASAQNTSDGQPHTNHRKPYVSPGPYPQNRLANIGDPDEKTIISQAEFLVDGDPEAPKALTLVSFRQSPGPIMKTDTTVVVNSIRTNEPDIEDPADSILWTMPEMKQAQQADPLLKHIIKYLKNPTNLNKQMVDPNIKDLDSFILDNTGILYKKQLDTSAELRGEEEVIVVPYTLQQRAMASIHSSHVAGHPGPDRSCWAAHRHFWWRNMNKHIKRYAETCKICLKCKGYPHPPVSKRRYPVPPRPWHTLSIDLIGRLPATRDKYKFILVCVDHLTRYTTTSPLKNKSASEVATALIRTFCEHGFPTCLLSDNGTEFNNKLITELAALMGFRHKTIVAYHPSSQGLVERKNGSIMTALRQVYLDRPHDWSAVLPWATLYVNSAYCSSIGDTPYFLMKSRDPDSPLQVCSTPGTLSKTPQQAIVDEKERAKAAFEIVKGKLLEAADRSARTTEKKAKACKIKVDDRVYLRYVRHKKGDNKLTPKFSGPFRVLSQKSPSVFKLKNLINNKVTEAHVENLKLVKEDVAPLEVFPQARLPLQDPKTLQPDVSNEIPLQPPQDPDDPADENDFLGFAPDDPYL